ncbi:MAG: SURF1 family protein [Nocardioidaceae bacterium]
MSRWFTLRALGSAVVALILMTAMVLLGRWQFGVYDSTRTNSARAQLDRPPVPLDGVLGRDSAFPADGVGRPVTATGRYVAAEQMYVRDMPGARSRYAVVTPLVTPAGSAVLVVRGSSSTRAAPPPAKAVRIEGLLEPSDPVGQTLDRQRITDGIQVASLVSSFRQDLYDGYVVLRRSQPSSTASLSPVNPPRPDPSAWAGVRNLLYAIQWWVFAGFVAFMWWRMINDATNRNHTNDRDAELVA